MLHMKRNDSTGKLFRIALRYMQQSTGFYQPFHTKPFQSYDHLLPHSWLKQLFQYLDSRQITVELSEDVTLPMARKGDGSIIEILSKHFTTPQMKILNRFRIHLQVMYLSEITDISGRSLLPNIKEVKNFRSTIWEWPNQWCPVGYEKMWHQACSSIQKHLYAHSLGRWIDTTQIWNWKISKDLSRVHHTQLGSFRLQDDRYKKHYVRCEDVGNVCNIDADMYHFRNRLQLLQHEVVICPDTKKTIDPFDNFFENHLLPPAMEKKIIKLLKKNRLIYGSDATVMDGLGGFAWGIMDKQNSSSLLLKSHAPVHGTAEQTHSTSGELFGLLGCMRHISYLKKSIQPNFPKKLKYWYLLIAHPPSRSRKLHSISRVSRRQIMMEI